MRVGSAHLVVPAGGYLDDPVQAALPAGTAPDDYYLGLLVTPEPATPGAVQVVTRLAGLIDFDVPGARHSQLRIEKVQAPTFRLGARLPVTVTLYNPGRSFVTAWGQVDYHATFGSPVVAPFPGRFVIAPGKTRTVTVAVRPGGPAGLVHFDAVVFYNKTPATITQVNASASTWWIAPVFVPVIPAAVIGIGVAWRLGRRRARRRNLAPVVSV